MDSPGFVFPLPLQFAGFHEVPAVPFQLDGLIETLLRLIGRRIETGSALEGLTNGYTIGGTTASAHEFLFGAAAPGSSDAAIAGLLTQLRTDPSGVLSSAYRVGFGQPANQAAAGPPPESLTSRSLDRPEQFSIGWTNYQGVYARAAPSLPRLAASLTDANEATNQFWPTIAKNGLLLNLLVLEKLGMSSAASYRRRFGRIWDQRSLERLLGGGRLFAIDTTIFETVSPQQVAGVTRFTQAALTLLEQDPATKRLTPIAVRISGSGGAGAQLYMRGEATDSAWLYALQAAKTSLTVYGFWLAHLYQLHLVSGALQMTAFHTIRAGHPLGDLLHPQSRYLIPFDIILLLLWGVIAPPTSVTDASQFLELTNAFGKNRVIFDDDPPSLLSRQGLRPEDFSVTERWDQFPTARRILDIWRATQEYVDVFVETTYRSNFTVAADTALQAWMAASEDRFQGNIRGLPSMNTKAALKAVLTSFLYRINIHGIDRLTADGLPDLLFLSNFPLTLHDATIPEPQAVFDTARLLQFLPKTGTIGEALSFYYTFLYSKPYDSMIPEEGVREKLFFPGGFSDPRNQALVRFRLQLIDFMNSYSPGMPTIQQWPLNVET